MKVEAGEDEPPGRKGTKKKLDTKYAVSKARKFALKQKHLHKKSYKKAGL